MSKPLQGHTCLVTGAAGYLGTHLTDALLARGARVHALDMVELEDDREHVTCFKGDIRDTDHLDPAMAGVDVVFHAAALIDLSTWAPAAHRERVWSVNVDGTAAVLDAAVRAGATRFVHTSSTNVVFNQDTDGGDETGPYSTSSDLYSSTKRAAEELVLARDGQDGLHTCALRPGGIYGPGERKTIVGPLFRSIRKGSPVILFGAGDSLLDYAYIDNIVDAQLRAAERLEPGSAVGGQAYFITDGQPYNPGAFSSKLVDLAGVKARRVRVPRLVGRLLARAMEARFKLTGAKLVLPRVAVDLATQQNWFRIDKARRDLGYEPLVDADEGLRRTAEEVRTWLGAGRHHAEFGAR